MEVASISGLEDQYSHRHYAGSFSTCASLQLFKEDLHQPRMQQSDAQCMYCMYCSPRFLFQCCQVWDCEDWDLAVVKGPKASQAKLKGCCTLYATDVHHGGAGSPRRASGRSQTTVGGMDMTQVHEQVEALSPVSSVAPNDSLSQASSLVPLHRQFASFQA